MVMEETKNGEAESPGDSCSCLVWLLLGANGRRGEAQVPAYPWGKTFLALGEEGRSLGLQRP